MEQALPKRIQSALERYPFSVQPVQRQRSERPARFDTKTHRRIILTKLHCDMPVIDEDIKFLVAQPEAARWLEDNVEPQLWIKIQSRLESRQ